MFIMTMIHFFLSIDNLKGYFEHYDNKNNIVGRVQDKKKYSGYS